MDEFKTGASRTSFEARYHDTCGNCGHHIKPGETVTYEIDELVHARCPEEPEIARRPPCSVCGLEHPGEC